MYIAIDFDGTIVEHEFPRLGPPVPGALDAIREWQSLGARVILFTVRSGEYLTAAVKYCEDNGIILHGVNQNPDQTSWSSSPKAYAHTYIDDAAFGCPLLRPILGRRPYLDWSKVHKPVTQQLEDYNFNKPLA